MGPRATNTQLENQSIGMVKSFNFSKQSISTCSQQLCYTQQQLTVNPLYTDWWLLILWSLLPYGAAEKFTNLYVQLWNKIPWQKSFALKYFNIMIRKSRFWSYWKHVLVYWSPSRTVPIDICATQLDFNNSPDVTPTLLLMCLHSYIIKSGRRFNLNESPSYTALRVCVNYLTLLTGTTCFISYSSAAGRGLLCVSALPSDMIGMLIRL